MSLKILLVLQCEQSKYKIFFKNGSFFYWFCWADIWDDCSKVEGIHEATGGPRFYRFKWIFPVRIACLLSLSFSSTKTALSMSQVKKKRKKKCILSRHTKRKQQQSKPSPGFFMMRSKKSINTMRCTSQTERSKRDRQSPGIRLLMLGAFGQHKQTRICSIRKSKSKQKLTRSFFLLESSSVFDWIKG